MRKNFVYKCMANEKRILRTIIISIIAVVTLFFLVFLPSSLKYVLGLNSLETGKDIEQFCESNSIIGDLHFSEVYDTQSPMKLETTIQDNYTILGAYGGGTISGETRKIVKEYNVYFLVTADNNLVIYCSLIEDDFSKNVVKVSNLYEDLEEDIKDDYEVLFADMDVENIYVLYNAINDPISTLGFFMCLYIILAILFVFLHYSKFVQKRSRLGKRIKELGDYDQVVKDINKQVDNAIFKSYFQIICEDYFIIYEKLPQKNSYTTIIKNSDIKEVVTTKNIDYPDEIIDITIVYLDNGKETKYTFNVYNQEDKETILNKYNEKSRRE